jgi:superfamily I DNA/RNA helicase
VKTLAARSPRGRRSGDGPPALDALAAGEVLAPLARRCGGDFECFLTEIALGAEADALDPRADAVTLLTIHAAKGLEFGVVFVAGCERGLIPLWLPGRRAGRNPGAVPAPQSGGAQPGTGNADPRTRGARPGAGDADPGAGNAGPGTRGTEPGTDRADPGTRGAEPGADDAGPGTRGAEPGAGDRDPGLGAGPATGGTDLAEERRLLFVAMTRARAHLFLTCAARRHRHATVTDAGPSPFLASIDLRLLDRPAPPRPRRPEVSQPRLL